MSNRRLRKDLGQNFLVDPGIRDKIVAAASVSPSDIVIEIGPGEGALTFSLADRALFLLAVEIDKRFCHFLNENLGDADNVEVRNANFLRLDLEREVSGLMERFPQAKAVKIVSNLPFYITTPIVTRIIENRSSIASCLVTVQKEVADRFTADPGSKRYGAITLFLNYYATVRTLFSLSKEVFRPRPEVDAAAISLVPRAQPAVTVKDEEYFFRVIRAAFQQRRKMVKNSLRSLGLSEERIASALDQSGLSPGLRPERLSIDDFARLSDSLSAAGVKNITTPRSA